ncbi:major facilitator protein [Dioszegia hungarica]|uniref:Major facilitator protein n=1 Tax=Dioszegia hungarica TaxID=4972 RepID=A0AA38LS50_9TREE|nr:major facilitator protein [Dioszegia hungarica]KAI9632189.1 major facilitator protein [Dioszegia hungarica]
MRSGSIRNVLEWVIAASLLASTVQAFRIPIADTDSVREVCSGMYGGGEAHIEVTFYPESTGQVALVIYEWGDVPYLGVDTPEHTVGGVERPKTYICTSSAVRTNLCTAGQLGQFITTYPEGYDASSSSIYTSALQFSSSSGGGSSPPAQSPPIQDEDEPEELTPSEQDEAAALAAMASLAGTSDGDIDERTVDLDLGLERRYKNASDPEGNPVSSAGSAGPQTYDGPVRYQVAKTGYYCVGIVPVTLVNSRSVSARQATHAEYAGEVLFRNTFEGELPAVEYPKINLYLGLSVIYLALGLGWGFLCFKHFRELLPMQYYISGTIAFLIIEMLAQYAYYRYINKHGGGTTSIVFLFVIAILNAARNSLSFFLLLIVSMGLSVVTQSLGGVMTRVRVLTGFHFVFGVMYAVGTVQVALDSANLFLVLLLIFPLSFSLTLFLMWIIISLNATILHLSQRRQKQKLLMFQNLWRILVVSVIAVLAFFVVSSMSLSSRLDEDYAPRNWRWRWVLLDGSLAGIYLGAFAAVAWLWRPTRDNVRFAMSQELAQDENEADAEDYEIDSLERGTHQRLGTGDDIDDGDDDGEEGGRKGQSGVGSVREENVVFQMGEDSDDESEAGGEGGRKRGGGYADEPGAGAGEGAGRRRSGSGSGGSLDGERERLRS